MQWIRNFTTESALFKSCRVDLSFGSGRDLMGRGGIFQADTKEDWINVVNYFSFLRRRQSLCVFVFALPHMKYFLKLRSTLKEIYFFLQPSRKHAYIILTPLNPSYIYRKTEVYRDIIIFLTSTHNLCFEQKYEKYQIFLSEKFHFLVVKFSVYLNRLVFVMRPHFRREAK